MPVRSIPRSYRSITGRLAGFRPGQSVEHESLLERDCALLFQSHPAVASIESQPVRIEFVAADAKGRPRRRYHIPDYLVRFQSRSGRAPLLVEVKYREELRAKHDEILPKVRAARRYARQRGWNYRIYTDRHIRGEGHQLTNLKFLQSYRRDERDTRAAGALSLALTSGAGISARTLLERCAGSNREARARFVACLWRMVATHEVHADLRAAPLNLETIIHSAAPTHGATASTRPILSTL